MSPEQTWAIYFAGICAIRFHPKNDALQPNDAERIRYAATIADLMMEQHQRRFPVCGQPSPAQP